MGEQQLDDGLEINFVCEESNNRKRGAPGAKRRLRKGRNKYDKRRERSQRSKDDKKEESASSSAAAESEEKDAAAVNNEKETKEEKEMVTEESDDDDKKDHKKKDENNNDSDDDDDDDDDEDVVMKSDENTAIVESVMRFQTFHTEPDDVDENKDRPSPSSPPSLEEAEEVTPAVQQPISRRVHASDALVDEEERAKYMAEYHARPLEMDRRSNASKIIKKSQPSDHIFASDFDQKNNSNDNGDDDDDEEENKKKTDSCPFRSLGLHDRLVSSLTSPRGKFRLERPTVIQCRTISSLLPSSSSGSKKEAKKNRHNLFVQSETGSGKTLAYLLPIVQSLAIDPTTNEIKKTSRSVMGTRCIIICPTRELAVQTHQIATQLCLSSFSTFLVSCCLSGGEKRKSEKSRLRKGASIVIATPGRLLDHLSKTECFIMSFKKGSLDWLVLDEADRLLDMGLGNQIEKIMNEIKVNQRGLGSKGDGVTWRSVLVSATVTKELETLARQTLGGGDDQWKWARATKDDGSTSKISNNNNDDDDADVNEKKKQEIQQLANAAPRQLAQLHITVSAKLRLASLVGFLVGRVAKGERTVVFMSTCDGVDYHHALFSKMDSIMGNDGDGIFGDDCRLYRLHGNVPHAERHSILAKFTDDSGANGKSSASILFATDVAARGLNIPGVDWIVQYDPPCETSDYVHRAGRTARAGKAGHAVVFLLPSESKYVDVLRLRGLNDVTALSLSSTLRTAAKACPQVTREGVKRSGGGYGKVGEDNVGDGRREGEAFAAAVQIRLEECVKEDDNNAILAQSADKKKKKKGKGTGKKEVGELHEMARQAFWSFLRAYPAKEKAVRQIFSARSLHLGHVARSFALKEPPKALRTNGKRRSRGSANSAKHEDDSEEEPVLKSTGRKRSSRLAFGSSGRGGKAGGAGLDTSDEKEQEYDANTDVGRNKKRQKKIAAKMQGNTGSFSSDVDAGAADDRASYSKKSKSNSNGRGNAQAKMMLAAKRMQSSGMEFF